MTRVSGHYFMREDGGWQHLFTGESARPDQVSAIEAHEQEAIRRKANEEAWRVTVIAQTRADADDLAQNYPKATTAIHLMRKVADGLEEGCEFGNMSTLVTLKMPEGPFDDPISLS